jgi:hypothetical protein
MLVKHQIPSTNIQIISKFPMSEIPPKKPKIFGDWSLGIEHYLEFGNWNLKMRNNRRHIFLNG